VELFAGIRVADIATSQHWYERLLGKPPSFMPNATEAVWQLGEHRHLYIQQDTEEPGGGLITIFLDDDVDALVADIATRGIEPAERETYSNGVRKATYRDPDGNEIGFGDAGVVTDV
jgi:catechol 2,3-dioxygenase-like lactoylglutathione lyase family enzyme